MLRWEKKMMTLLSFLHSILLGSGVYLLAAGFCEWEKEQSLRFLAGSLWLILPVSISWYAMRRISNLFQYLLLMFLTSAGIWILTKNAITVILCSVIFVLRAYVRIVRGRIRKMMREMPGEIGARMDVELWEIPTLLDQPKTIHWFFFLVVYAGLIALKKQELLQVQFWLFFAETVVCFIYRYLEQLVTFIETKKKIANLPAGRIRKTAQILFLAGIGLFFLFVLPAVIYQKEPLTKLHFQQMEIPPQTEAVVSQNAGADLAELLQQLETKPTKPPKWLIYLSIVLQYVITAGIVVGVMLVLIRFCRRLFSNFADGEEEGDEIIFLGEEEEKQRKKEKQTQQMLRYYAPEKVIRRKYKKMILKGRKEKPLGYETPEELEMGSDLEHLSDIEQFHILYEKARYSLHECTQQEAREYALSRTNRYTLRKGDR